MAGRCFEIIFQCSFYQDGEQKIEDADDFCLYILKEAYVSLVTGAAFGSPNCVRLSYAASDEELAEALKRIKQAVEKLK